MKNILVIGGTGFIGSNLVKSLVKKEVGKIYVLIRKESKAGIRNLLGVEDQIETIKANVNELINNNTLPQFDVCYNLAAYGVKYDEQDIHKMNNVNVDLLNQIIDFAAVNKTKLIIHTGSCFEYGVNEGKKISEESELNPQALYGATKVAATITGNIYAKLKGVSMITVRPFSVYGPGEASYRLLPQLIDAAMNNKELKMTKGEQIRDYLYIDDLVNAYIELSSSNNIDNYNIYNICSSVPMSIKEFVDVFCKVYKCDRKIFNMGAIDYRKNEVMHFIGDNNKLKSVIEWNPETKIEDGIRKSIDYFINKYK